MHFLLKFYALDIKIDPFFRFINIIKYGCGPSNCDGPAHLHLPFWRRYHHQRYIFYNREFVQYRAWVSTGAAGAWHPPKLWASPLAPADFDVLNTNWHPQSSFYVKYRGPILRVTWSYQAHFVLRTFEFSRGFWSCWENPSKNLRCAEKSQEKLRSCWEE